MLLGACLPALWLAWAAASGALASAAPVGLLGARPITEAIHQAGDWAIRFLWLSLAVTPLRRIANWPKLILVRRMLGVTALLYALMHLTLYAVDLKFDLGFTANIIKRDQYLASESYIALSQSGQGCLQNWNPLPFQFGIRPAAAARNSGVPI